VKDDPEPARVAAQLGPEDSVLTLSLRAKLKFGHACPRTLSLNDLIAHDRMCALAVEAQSVLRRFLEVSCWGSRIDGIHWPDIFNDDQQAQYFRDLLLAEDIGAALIKRGVEQMVWTGETNIKPHLALHAFREGLGSIAGANLVTWPPISAPDTLSLQALGSKIQSRLRRIRALALPQEPAPRRCKFVSIFATSEWERFTDPLIDLHNTHGEQFQIWYLGSISERLSAWAAAQGITVVSVPYPQSVDSDISLFFAEHWKNWQEGAAKNLAEATGHPVIAGVGLQSHFQQFFTYTLPRTAQWARELEGFLRCAEPELLIGSAAFTYMTAFPYHVSRKLGIRSAALSHTYVSGDGTPVASDYLACRNRFERVGYRRSFPSDDKVIYCENSSNQISYVPREKHALGNGSRRIVAVLTAYSSLDDVIMPDVDIDAFWSTLESIAAPPAEFDDLYFVFKFHPRFDVARLLSDRISRPNVEIFPALASVTELLDEAWVVVICNHYGGVVADSIATGAPILFLNSARFFYPNIEPIGHEAGETLQAMPAFWEILERLNQSADLYGELAAKCRNFRANYLETTERRVPEQLGQFSRLSASSETATDVNLPAAPPYVPAQGQRDIIVTRTSAKVKKSTSKPVSILFNTWANDGNLNAQSLTAREIALRLDPQAFHSTLFLGHGQQADPRLVGRPGIRLVTVPPRLGSATIAKRMLWGPEQIIFYPSLNARASRMFWQLRGAGKEKFVIENIECSLPQIHALPPRSLAHAVKNIKGADACFAITSAISASLQDEFGVHAPVIPLGVNLDLFQAEDRSGHDLPVRVLYVASIQPRKQPHIMLDLARATRGEPLEFHLIGPVIGDPGYKERLLAEAARDGLNNVVFHGPMKQEEILSWMRLSDIFVLPSRLEGFGKVMIEAGATGLPSIVFSDYQTPTVIDGSTGFQVDTFDQMRDALLLLTRDRRLRLEMGAQAIKHAKQFDWNSIAARWEEAFLLAVEGRDRVSVFRHQSFPNPRDPNSLTPGTSLARRQEAAFKAPVNNQMNLKIKEVHPTPDPKVSNKEFFILGPSRSGTTLLARMLDAHPDLAVFPETWMFDTLDRLGCTDHFSHKWQFVLFMNEMWEHVNTLDPTASAVVAGVARATPHYTGPTKPIIEELGRLFSTRRGARVWGEKTPAHSMLARQMTGLFPDAAYLRIIRDPRDILVSYADMWNKGNYDSSYLMKTAALVKFYFSHVLAEEFWGAHESLLIRYENLVSDPVANLESICAYMDLPFSSDMVSFHQTEESRRTSLSPRHKNIDKPVMTSRVHRFLSAFSKDQLALIETFLKDYMSPIGYEPTTDCIVRPEMEPFLQQAEKAYTDFVNRRARRRAKLRARLKVGIFSIAGNRLSTLRNMDIAETETDWSHRIKSVPLAS
jgi:glycosyltransferase involved in cell wall biosynthesis